MHAVRTMQGYTESKSVRVLAATYNVGVGF